MDAEEILAQANANPQSPDGWVVFPLLKRKVISSIIGWILGVIIGAGLLALIAPIVIPGNYRNWFSGIVTTILLGVLLFIFIGSICMLCVDVLRLRNKKQHVIVVTDEYFVKQEGAKIIQIPLSAIRYVTARGRAPIDRTPPSQKEGNEDSPNAGENVMGFIFGRGLTPSGQRERRKRARTPSTLAFMDERTHTEVTVVNDDTYGDPFAIGGVLKQHIAAVMAATSEKK